MQNKLRVDSCSPEIRLAGNSDGIIFGRNYSGGLPVYAALPQFTREELPQKVQAPIWHIPRTQSHDLVSPLRPRYIPYDCKDLILGSTHHGGLDGELSASAEAPAGPKAPRIDEYPEVHVYVHIICLCVYYIYICMYRSLTYIHISIHRYLYICIHICVYTLLY